MNVNAWEEGLVYETSIITGYYYMTPSPTNTLLACPELNRVCAMHVVVSLLLLMSIFTYMYFTLLFCCCYCSSLHSVPRPTMSDLISMKRRDGSEKKLEIIRWIISHTSAKCDDFAHKVLNDKLTVRELRKKYSKDDQFVRAVLNNWVSRDDDSKEGSLPCTWDTLVQCVDESGLDGDFLKLLKDNVPTGMYTSVVCVHVYECYVTACTCMHAG